MLSVNILPAQFRDPEFETRVVQVSPAAIFRPPFAN
jgi:hypothetical protein